MATTVEYNSPQYDENKYKNNIDTSYYSNAIQKYTDAQEKNRATQTEQAKQQQTSALREAYISKMQNQKALNENLAQAGIRGGATETSNLKLANTYANQRNAANTDYNNSVNSINQNIDSNILNYDMDMTSRAEEYKQNMAQALWNADREDYANQIAQQNALEEQRIANENLKLSQAESAANIKATEQNTQLAKWSALYDNRWATVSTKKSYESKLEWIKKNLKGDEKKYAISALRASYQANKDKK